MSGGNVRWPPRCPHHAGMPTETKPRRAPDRSPKPPTKDQRLLTGQQIELEYGIAYRSLYDWYIQGKLPAVRVDRRLRFWRADLDSFLRMNSMCSSPATSASTK